MNIQFVVRPDIKIDMNEIAIEFFFVFSRFEYALKRAGYLLPGTDAKANWDTYTSSFATRFNKNRTPELMRAVDYLISQGTAPKKQTISPENQLTWSDPPQRNDLVESLQYSIRTVRNNLFHGEKYTDIFFGETGPAGDNRNLQLLRSSLIVLYEFLNLGPNNVKRNVFSGMSVS
jgi:hypothetical protein